MRQFETRTLIAAPAERIWPILTDSTRLGPDFGILRLQGQIVLGGTLRLRAAVAPTRDFVLRVRVLEPTRRMVWQGGMPLGLFTGTRTFTLEPVPGGCEFAMVEVYSGLMAPLIFKSLPDLTPAFRQFAAALKKEAEA
jgi:hypothetical protein